MNGREIRTGREVREAHAVEGDRYNGLVADHLALADNCEEVLVGENTSRFLDRVSLHSDELRFERD